jgi:hypothetical protein
MGQEPGWKSFDEARELFYAADLAHRASSRPLNAVPLLRRSVLLLLRALALTSGVTSAERDEIVAAALEVDERERIFRFPIASDLELLDELESRFAGFDAETSKEEARRLEQLLEAMPRTLISVRRHLKQSNLKPEERARHRRRVRWVLAASSLAAAGALAVGIAKVGLPLYRVLTSDGISGAYFADPELAQFILERRDAAIDFDWQEDAPASEFPADKFSVRWTGKLRIPESGHYNFYLNSDDGSRLYLDGKLVVDNWSDHGPLEKSGSVDLKAGTAAIRVEYFDARGGALIRLSWSTPSLEKQVIGAKYFVR